VIAGLFAASLSGCSSIDPTQDVPALNSAQTVSLLPTHAAINSALGRNLPSIQEPREIRLDPPSSQPSNGSPCHLLEGTFGHPAAATVACQVIVGTPGDENAGKAADTVIVETFRFPEVGSATAYMKTLSMIHDECGPKRESDFGSGKSREPSFTTWTYLDKPSAAFQRGRVVGYVSSPEEGDVKKIATLLSDTLADFR
jgi:hypothetical protein